MDETLETTITKPTQYIVPVANLLSILDSNRDIQSVLSDVVEEAHRIGRCDHVFLSRYVVMTKEFEPIAWRSTVVPVDISLKQKFMGDRYVDNLPVVLNDLTPYNYRMRPDVARLGLKSLIGIPLMGRKGLLGVIECFSREISHFSNEMEEGLFLLARQVALLLESAEQEKFCKLLSIENDFIHEIQKTQQLSDGLLLYRLGETLVSLLDPDGIAVFGLELNVECDVLQDVMAKGFSMKDISLLKKAIKIDFLDKLKKLSVQDDRTMFLKHPAEEKLLYIVPVIWQEELAGIIVYYWAKAKSDADIATMEQFASRVIQFASITLKKNAAYNTIQRISFVDSLTELANRRLFDYLLAREFAKAKQKHIPLSILLIDLDHFKQINDQYGHQVGDEILQEIAKILKQDFQNANIPSRYGGEEFVVILPNVRFDDAVTIGDNFRKKVEATQFMSSNQSISLTVSIGVATAQEVGGRRFTDTISFLKAADKALYTAKQEGRNRVIG